ncbi:hypothetical protein L9F63_017494, partial [Diploptera punctata]
SDYRGSKKGHEVNNFYAYDLSKISCSSDWNLIFTKNCIYTYTLRDLKSFPLPARFRGGHIIISFLIFGTIFSAFILIFQERIFACVPQIIPYTMTLLGIEYILRMSESLADSLYESLSQLQSSNEEINGGAIASSCSSIGSHNASGSISKSLENVIQQTECKSQGVSATRGELESDEFPQNRNIYVPRHKRTEYSKQTIEEEKLSGEISQKKNTYIPPYRRKGYSSPYESKYTAKSESVSLSEIQSSKLQTGVARFHSSSSHSFGSYKDYDKNQENKNISDSKCVKKDNFSKTSYKTYNAYSKSKNVKSDRAARNEFRNHNTSKWLEDLEDKTPSVTLKTVGENIKHFETIMNQQLNQDLLIKLFKVIVKLCTVETNDTVITILSCAINRMFIDQLSNHIFQHIGSQNKNVIEKILLEDVFVFLGTLAKLFPSRMADGFQSIFIAVDNLIKYYEDHNITDIDTKLKYQFEYAKTLHMTCANNQSCMKKERNKSKIVDKSPEENFRELNIFPKTEDILSEKKSFIRPNIINGKYESVEHYLDIQFRLLREDFFAPLREAISEYRSTSGHLMERIDNIRIYRKVRFLRPNIERHTVGLVVSFDHNNLKHIDWNNSKMFMYGSLLLFSKDNFDRIIFATVAGRDINTLKNGQIVVKLEDNIAYSNELFLDEFVMVESEVFFEPYHHVLKALHDMESYTFPMEKYIVHVETSHSIPKYMLRNKESVCASIGDFNFNPLDEASWPSAKNLELDESQYNALRSALTKEFVIIQGPPGTGKTFIGHKIAEILLQNSVLWSHTGRKLGLFSTVSRPLIVLCYTNHALDQFLEKIICFTHKIVRVGSRSTCTALEKFNLMEKRGHHVGSRLLHKLLRNNINSVILRMRSASDSLQRMCNGIVSYSVLKQRGILGQNEHYFENNIELFSEECFVDWLMYGMYDYLPSEKEINFLSEIQAKMESYYLKTELRNVNVDWKILRKEFYKINNNDDFYDDYYYEDYEVFENVGFYGRREIRGCESHSYVFYESCSECRTHSFIRDELTFLKTKPHLWYILEHQLEYVDGMYFHPVTLALNVKNLELKQKKAEEAIQCTEKRVLKEPNLQNQLYFQQWNNKFLKLQLSYIKKHLRVQENNDRETIENLLQKDLEQMQTEERWTLYRYWIQQLRIQILDEFEEMKDQFKILTRMDKEVNEMNDLITLQSSLVVGLTTTSAARLRSLLQTLQAPIVIVEEAAEVMESHIVASLSGSCEHLILIGDHKQLRPSPALFKLAREYDFDVSLFERMLNNGICCDALKLQHRMRPEISRLIAPTIYPNLQDHPDVLKFEKVKGMLKSVFFLTHNEPEDESPDGKSHRNSYEAELLLSLCCYLIHQGYESSQITILTTLRVAVLPQIFKFPINPADGSGRWLRQMAQADGSGWLRQMAQADADGSGRWLRVVVLLQISKFPINPADDIQVSHKSSRWLRQMAQMQMAQQMEEKELEMLANVRITAVDNFQGEENDIILLSLVRSNANASIGFLNVENRVCVALSRARIGLYIIGNMDNLTKSSVIWPRIKKTLKEQDSIDTFLTLRCQNHASEFTRVKTSNDFLKVPNGCCSKVCGAELECGHSCKNICHLNDRQHKEMFECKKPCVKTNKNCKENHLCTKHCYEECDNCNVQVLKILPICGHEANLECSMEIETYACKVNCEKILQCDHPCPRLCSDVCGNCQVEVTKKIVECGHSILVKCCEDPVRTLCKETCTRTLECGHPCSRLCCEDCGNCQIE